MQLYCTELLFEQGKMKSFISSCETNRHWLHWCLWKVSLSMISLRVRVDKTIFKINFLSRNSNVGFRKALFTLRLQPKSLALKMPLPRGHLHLVSRYPFVMSGGLYSEVQCIIGNGHMGIPPPTTERQTSVKTFELRWRTVTGITWKCYQGRVKRRDIPLGCFVSFRSTRWN